MATASLDPRLGQSLRLTLLLLWWAGEGKRGFRHFAFPVALLFHRGAVRPHLWKTPVIHGIDAHWSRTSQR